ncbi:unnamed protein product (macronuclear) [Paramecium tetraurelia]|uniref:sphingomyelin phosphodiesterase n=1 Tax=Paramecium tetraurelia TaxID=5888 RepID=A0DMK4_PARTE|nr:uncharacterized protein GSPATT00018489001 [Paramecium tetraurelia]CAK84271.1 unnamed protein product [Paramecium tetraurelia]|eukprot:XP_001451668.1 hypothetical protein (macronuclear) [Paramecium tetraurelia strain d4-2]
MSSNSEQVPLSFEQIPEKDIIKILTYNTFLRPPVVNNNGDDYKNERCELIIKELMNFDIVCLQEVFGFLNSRKSILKHKAFKLGFTYQAVSPSPSFFSSQMVDGGLVTLSRYPILSHEFKEFPYGILSDNLSNKGVLYTKILVNGQMLHLFNTHLQASYVGKESNVRATVSTRIDQLYCFKKFVHSTLEQQQAQENDLILLVGDYNIDSRYEQGYPNDVLKQFPILQQQLGNPQKYQEYDALISIMTNNGKDKFINLLLEQEGKFLITYADYVEDESGQKKPMEIQLTDKADLLTGQCLDYIFQMIPENQGNPNQIKIKQVNVEKFFVEGQKFTQLSDHYGVSCDILVKLPQ